MITFQENMSQDIFDNIIENEKLEISNKFKVFKTYKKALLSFSHKIVDDLKKIEKQHPSSEILSISSNLTRLLKKAISIQELFAETFNYLEAIPISKNEIEITKYNHNIEQLQNDCNSFITEFETLTQDCLKVIEFSYSEPLIVNIEEKSTINDIDIVDNKCLLISEKKNKVFLPYTVDNLKNQLKKSYKHYSCINDLIQNEYILPLKRFNNPILSRFRESYILMTQKENSSFIDAINLALELSVNSSLNPAVIAACQNKDELDIYLDCLYEKELEQFEIFDIIYEINPK